MLVGEATRRATEPAIVYEDAGTFELKGKEGETQLWRALRVVSGARGALKSQGLEAPFVGRDRELRQIKDLFHTCAEEGKAHLVSVTGIAGIGKSRLAWEFYKYFDGLAADRLLAPRPLPRLRRGRDLLGAGGHGADALPDRRGRRAADRRSEAAGGARGAPPRPGGAAFVEPRLAQLLGLGEQEARDRQELFAAWRLFFERLADVYPTVLAFEDMQWADAVAARLRRVPAGVVAEPPALRGHARPAGAGRAPADVGGRAPQLHLALPRAAPGGGDAGAAGRARAGAPRAAARADPRPGRGRAAVRGRDGADAARPRPARRGRLASTGRRARSTRSRCPETLHALIAARLDGLSRRGAARCCRTPPCWARRSRSGALAALTGADGPSSTRLLAGAGPQGGARRSSPIRARPSTGQYGFLQDLLRQVAYETLPKRERRAKPPGRGRAPRGGARRGEVAEVVASHLLDAYRLDPRRRRRARSLRTSARARWSGRASARLARRRRRGAALLRAGGRARRRPAAKADSLIRAGADGAAARRRASCQFALRAGDRALRRRSATRTPPHVPRVGWRGSIQILGQFERGDRADGARLRSDLPRTSPTPTWPSCSRGSAHSHRSPGTTRRRRMDRTGSRRSPRPLQPRSRSYAAGISRRLIVSPRRPQEARGLFQLALETALGTRSMPQQSFYGNLSDLGFQRDRYADSLGHLDAGGRILREGSAIGGSSGSRSAR